MGKVETRARAKARAAAAAATRAKVAAATRAAAALKDEQRKIVKAILSENRVILHNIEFINYVIQYYLDKKKQKVILRYGEYTIPILKICRIFHFTYSNNNNDNNFIIEFNDKKRIIFRYKDALPKLYLSQYFSRNNAVTRVDLHTFTALFDKERDRKNLSYDYDVELDSAPTADSTK